MTRLNFRGFRIRRAGRSIAVVLAACPMALYDSRQRARADFACPSFTPVMALELTPIYRDARRSVPDPAAESRNAVLLANLDSFMIFEEKALDGSDKLHRDKIGECAYAAFKNWAGAGALSAAQPVYNLEGIVKRSEHLVGLNILALKFKRAGFPIDATILGWLRGLNEQNMLFWERSSNRGNLYVWSGAAAGLFALLDRDERAVSYQDRVWRDALSKIREDGTVEAEMERGRRALIYHLYSFSAALVLKAARDALGFPISTAGMSKLQSLGDKIGETLCDSREMAMQARATMEMPGDWGFRVPNGFGRGVISDAWQRCGKPHANFADPTFGGDTALSFATITAAGERRDLQ